MRKIIVGLLISFAILFLLTGLFLFRYNMGFAITNFLISGVVILNSIFIAKYDVSINKEEDHSKWK